MPVLSRLLVLINDYTTVSSNTMLLLPVPTKWRGNGASCQQERAREREREVNIKVQKTDSPSVCVILHRTRGSGIKFHICHPTTNSITLKRRDGGTDEVGR